MDLAKVKRVSWDGPNQEEKLIVCHPANPVGTYESVKQGIAWMDRWLNLGCPVAVDIETSSINFLSCKLYSIALAGDDGYNAAVTFTLANHKSLPWDAELALTQKMREILISKRVSTVYHNAPFDYAVLTHKGYTIDGPIEDTQGYHHLVQPDIPHDLGWIGHTYLDVEPWKLNHLGEKQAFTSDVIELLVYNAKDALNTCKLRRLLIEDILTRGMSHELMSYQMAFARLAANMELVGLPVNWDKRRMMGEKLLNRNEELKHRMRQWLNWEDFNPMNKNHAVRALYDKKYVGLLPTSWTEKTKQPSTRYEDIIDHMEHPFVKDFIAYVEGHHVFATQYRDPPPHGKKGPKGGAYWRAKQADGRIHVKWNPTGQKGSRFTSQPNVQNQRVGDREFFEAPEGRVFIGADKDQLELRLAAVFAGVRELLVEMAKEDGDPHTLAAINIYGDDFLKKEKAVRKRLRDAVKTTVYASLYRAGVKTVHKSIRKKKFLDPALRASLTVEAVAHIYHSYFGKYVEIPLWHDQNFHLAETQGWLETPPFGRRRYFPVQPPPFTEVANWGIQTCGSDVVGKSMVEIQDELSRRWADAHIILHGHDALYIECYERHAEEIKDLVNQMFGHHVIEGPAGSVDLTAGASIGKTLKAVK